VHQDQEVLNPITINQPIFTHNFFICVWNILLKKHPAFPGIKHISSCSKRAVTYDSHCTALTTQIPLKIILKYVEILFAFGVGVKSGLSLPM